MNESRIDLIDLLEDVLGAMQGYQKASGADRADWDFTDEIKNIEKFLCD